MVILVSPIQHIASHFWSKPDLVPKFDFSLFQVALYFLSEKRLNCVFNRFKYPIRIVRWLRPQYGLQIRLFLLPKEPLIVSTEKAKRGFKAFFRFLTLNIVSNSRSGLNLNHKIQNLFSENCKMNLVLENQTNYWNWCFVSLILNIASDCWTSPDVGTKIWISNLKWLDDSKKLD